MTAALSYNLRKTNAKQNKARSKFQKVLEKVPAAYGPEH